MSARVVGVCHDGAASGGRCTGRQFDRTVVQLLCGVLADEDGPAAAFVVGG